jgi:hypothetical protein
MQPLIWSMMLTERVDIRALLTSGRTERVYVPRAHISSRPYLGPEPFCLTSFLKEARSAITLLCRVPPFETPAKLHGLEMGYIL